LHVALVLILQSANSLLLFANIYHAINDVIDEISNGSIQKVGSLLVTLYKQPNSTEVVIPIGNNSITLNSTQISNTTYLNTTLNQLPDQQAVFLVFDIFGKVFESYSISTPSAFHNLLDRVLDGQVSDDEGTYETLFEILGSRFSYSTLSYLVSCVISIVSLSNDRDLTCS
jgi:hypothetical protein